jgi:hypothetical protein
MDYIAKGESELNLAVMRMIDETHTKIPFYGRRRMREHLFRQGVDVNVKRVGRLMNVMGIETIYPRRNLSKPNPEHRVFPYLLRGVRIDRQDHVWSTDITYIRMRHGFMYLMAIMDWGLVRRFGHFIGYLLRRQDPVGFCNRLIFHGFSDAVSHDCIESGVKAICTV